MNSGFWKERLAVRLAAVTSRGQACDPIEKD